MDDARNLQYGIGFDTAYAETSVENLGEKVETLEENIGAVEVGAQQMGASAVSACQMGQGAAERFTGAVVSEVCSVGTTRNVSALVLTTSPISVC